jgi:methyltransferase (TIGR00027 family)
VTDAAAPSLSGVHTTAIGAAIMRAAHLLTAGEPKIFHDSFALPLTGLTAEQTLATAELFGRANGAEMAPAWALRSRYAEDRLAAARPAQYVVLGAGLDSYALRTASEPGQLTIFEVDDPPMQAWKRHRMEQLRLGVPPRLRFVPCDFETTSLPEALSAGGFDHASTALVSWLGVTQYLSREAILSTLRWAARLPRGSQIVLTFVVPCAEAEKNRAAFAARGVHFATFFTPDQMSALLEEAGFRHVEHLTLEAADRIYFSGRTDGLRAPAMERLVAAVAG